MLPKNLQPMLATMAKPFNSLDFTYEIKWDGYRCLAFIDSEAHLFSRNQHEITHVFPELTELAKKVQKPGCIIDGEIVTLRNGKPNFLELQKRAQLRNSKKINQIKAKIPVIYIVFDLLYHKYLPVYQKPIEERRCLLFSNCYPDDKLIIADFIEQEGIAYFEAVSKLGLEGVVAKKKGTPYLPGKRATTWLKFKKNLIQNFIVTGYKLNLKPKGEIRSLMLGAYVEDQLRPFGMVGSGFTQKDLVIINTELPKIKTTLSPFTGTIFKQSNIIWIQPIIVCEIEYLELTDEGILRHPVFKRFRPEVKPRDCQYGE